MEKSAKPCYILLTLGFAYLELYTDYPYADILNEIASNAYSAISSAYAAIFDFFRGLFH